MALVDALGNLFRFLLLPGQAHDMKGVAPLIKGASFGALPTDKAFDADRLLQDLDERGATVVIPPKSNRKVQRDYVDFVPVSGQFDYGSISIDYAWRVTGRMPAAAASIARGVRWLGRTARWNHRR